MRFLPIAAMLLALSAAADAGAQTREWPERIWIGAGGGVQPASSKFDDAFDVPLHAETERVTVGYPVSGGTVISVRGGYRLWKRFTVGAGVSRYSRRAAATVHAQLPHPFFDDRFREVEGTTSALRGETAAHLLVGWMMPITNRIRVIFTAGPSFLNVEQTLVTGVQFAETYPYDTAEFTDATTRRSTRGAAGFNAGADVMWMFTPRIGAGVLVQATRARVRVDAGDGRTIAVDAGGAQAAAGIRVVF
jgi:hypothetical protein